HQPRPRRLHLPARERRGLPRRRGLPAHPHPLRLRPGGRQGPHRRRGHPLHGPEMSLTCAQRSSAKFVAPPMRPSPRARLAALLNGGKVETLPNFDLRRYHFGFLLSYNTSDFFMRLKPESPFRDSLMVLEHQKQPGFNLGIVASLRLNDNVSLRFLPTLSFQERILQYKFLTPDAGAKYFIKPAESPYLA